MSSPLTVDADRLRQCATDLAGIAARVADAVAQSPPLGVAEFGWQTANAVADLEADVDRQLARLGTTIAETARQLTTSVDQYETADARAAAELQAAARG